MPKGGPRPGSGRPTKAQALEKARLLAETIKHGPKTLPRQYLQGLLDSPASTKTERLRAAELLLRCPSDAPAATVSPSLPPIILAIPRGCFMSEQQTADPDQLISHGVPIEPYTGTPDWTRTALSDQREAPVPREPVPFEVAEAEAPQNLVRLDSFKTRRDDDGSGPGAA
jgi:hypothetical protein